MNNLKQKNIIYKRDIKDVLPHTGKGDSIVLESNSNITDARLNNAFQQLVNNDLYLENRLVAGLNYQPGPEGAQSESIISALPDGSKRWVNSNDYTKPLQIYKKVEVPLSQSIGLVRAAAVNFIAPVGDAVFVAFSDKLMYDKGSGLVECANSDSASVVAVGYCDGSNGTFFVSNESVYRLVQFTDAEGGIAYRLQKLNSTNMPGLKCVQYDAADGMLYVGGDGGFIARGHYSDQTTSVQFVQDIKFCADDVYGSASDTNRYVSDITVNALQILDRKDYSVNSGLRQTNILAATDGGVFRSDTRFFLEVKTSGTLAGKTCVDVVQHEGIIYVLTSDGYVYRQTDAGNMMFQKYPSSWVFTSPTGFASHSSGLYVACATGVYRYVQLGNNPEIQLEYEVSDVGAVTVATLFSERIVFAAVDDTVYYYSTPGKVRSIRFDGCSSIRQIVAQAHPGMSGSFDIYVIGENSAGSEQVFVAYIGFDQGKTTNFNRIDGEELIFEDVESVVCDGSCYYFSDGVIYNQTTGQQKRLGDVHVHQMEYLSSDGSLALATDAGFQVLNAETFDIICQNYDGELSNTWFASQSGSIACFATLSNIYVARREGASLNTVFVGGVGDGYMLCGVATSGEKIYAIGKAPGATDGVISSASLYYVRSIYAGSNEDGDEGGETVAHLEFPVMPFMAEATSAVALGISASQAYRLAYDGSSPSYETVTFPDTTTISAFCMVGSQVFIAADGKIRQYECSAAQFDPGNMEDLVAISSTTLANVNRLVYSGTDTTFDMRIYAKQGENGLSVYTPSFANIFKYAPATMFSDFIMYIDHDEGEDKEDQADDVYHAIMLGIGADANLHIISSVIGGADAPWIGSETISALPAIDEEYDGVPQSGRTPYQVFYADNSTVYVAYTAKIQEGWYSDYILAIDTGNLLHGEIGDTLDFVRLGRYSSSGQAGVSRFTGFNIPGLKEDDEDIDVIATCYRDELFGYTLATFKVGTNVDGMDTTDAREKLADVLSCTYFQSDPHYRCFQPDCTKLKIQSNTDLPITDDYYIIVPTITPDGNILRTYVFKYINSSNTCDLRGYADVEGVSSVGISSVYVSRFMQESETEPLLVVVDTNGMAFNVKASVGKTVQWSGNGIVSQILDGTQFQRIVRCGVRQLVGFDKARSFVYDFQSYTKQTQSSGYIQNIYATDTDDGRDYMLIQHTGDKKIFSVDPVQSLRFNPVTGLSDGCKTIVKANDTVFVIAWNGTTIYQENVGGGFTELAVGGFDMSSSGYIDAQIFYGRISGHSDNNEYYVFLLKQSGGVDVYAIIGASTKTLQKIYEFENPIYDETDPNTHLMFSYIQYAGYGSDFDTYLRKQAFNGIDHYDWPILIMPSSTQEYMYLDFQSRPSIRCTQLEPLTDSQYVSIGKDGETVYCVKVESGKAVVYSIDGTKLEQCDVPSDYAWLTRGKCIFQKTGGGIRYHDGDVWCDFGHDLYDFVSQTEDGLYYFVKASSRNLYKSVSIAIYPIRLGPVVSEITYVGLAAGSTPVRLASGRIYAGLVCQNEVGIRNLCILWPTDEYVVSPAGSGDSGAVTGYSVYACPASFDEFPDGRVNTMEVVPIGNYLDEIITYEGGYLHIAHIVESKLITDQTGYSIIPVINTLPWTDLGASFGAGIYASAKLNGRRYITSGTGLSSFTEGSSGMAMKILSPIMKVDGINARSFYEIGQNAFLIATDKGVYRYQHLEGMPVIGRMSPGTGYNIAQVTSYSFGSAVDMYLIANMLDGYLYSSENYRVWKKQFRPVPAPARLCAVYPKNAREWYFGASTGLYKSTYQYSEVDDLAKFTEDDLYSLYSELLSSDISSKCEDEMSQHELDRSYALGHLSSLMYNINANLLSVNFDGLQSSGWQHHTNTYSAAEYQVSNDIVFEQFWGSNTDWNLTLSVENQFISAANTKFTYLLRRWMSGITEIYVHIPTTNTYYINHVASTPNYNIDEDTTELSATNITQFGRNKMVFKHNPNEPGVYTTIKLALSRYVFFIDQMLEVQACGNSLPLKIYKETIRENGSDNDFEAAQYFNSYVAPTVLMSTAQTEDDYVFNFACFGADEQVIKLQFIDTTNKFDQEYCRLVFDSNGLNTDPDTFVKQRIRLDGQPYSLHRNQYQWPQDQRLFAGWTFTPNPPVNVDTSILNGFYNDKQQITSTEIEDRCGPIMSGQDVKLYAVWITYQFGASDTTILLSPQHGKTMFRLGQADMINDERIGDKIIIKFEEVD